MACPAAQQAYQPLGDLLFSCDGLEQPSDYRRELNLDTGIARIMFRVGDVNFTREVFVSYPDRILVVHLTADKPGRLSMKVQLKSPYLEHVTTSQGKLVMDGCWKGPITGNSLIAPVDGNGLRFQAKLVAIPEGGRYESSDDSVQIAGADSVTLLLSAATSYVNYHDITGDPASIC
jgi:alpha-L-fucosidase 2